MGTYYLPSLEVQIKESRGSPLHEDSTFIEKGEFVQAGNQQKVNCVLYGVKSTFIFVQASDLESQLKQVREDI